MLLWTLPLAPALAKKPKDDVAPVPSGPPTVEVPCPYVAGTSHQLQIVRIVEPPGGPVRSTSLLVDVQVLSATKSGAELSLTYGAAQLQRERDPYVIELTKGVAAAWAAKPAKLTVAHPGPDLALDNLDELKASFAAALDEVDATVRAKHPTAPADALQAARETYGAGLEGLVLGDLQPLLTYTCGTFPLENTTRMDYSTMAFDVSGEGRKLHVEVALKDGWPTQLEQIRTTDEAVETIRVTKTR